METTNKVVEVINALCEKFGVAVDWTGENVVPYAKSLMEKIVNYKLGISIFVLCLIPLLTLAIFFVAKVIDKKAREKDYDFDDGISWAATVLWTLFGIGCVASFVIIIVQSINIITCVTFPEKVVLDYITSMMGN
jgi:hypothetical protein